MAVYGKALHEESAQLQLNWLSEWQMRESKERRWRSSGANGARVPSPCPDAVPREGIAVMRVKYWAGKRMSCTPPGI